MATGDGDALSSSSISSPPVSPQNQDTIHVSRLPPSASHISGEGVVHSASGSPARAAATAITSTTTSTTTTTATATPATPANATPNGSAPKKPKVQRKKKEVPLGPDGKPLLEEKVKKPRKPREPKDKAAPTAASATVNGSTTTTAPRKKLKTEPKPDAISKTAQDTPSQGRQPTITEVVGTFQPQAHVSSITPTSTPTPVPTHSQMPTQHQTSDGVSRSNLPLPPSNPPTPRPISSGQNYDPIRGSTMAARPSDAAPPQPSIVRASASPSIASLIDAPSTAIKTSSQAPTYPPQPAVQQPVAFAGQTSPSPSSTKQTYTPFTAPPPQLSTFTVATTIPDMHDAKEIAPTLEAQDRPVPEIKAPSKSSSSPAPTPKAARPTPEPLKGTGSGLLSSSDLFGGTGSTEPSERKGVNIDLHIPLNPKGGNAINIAQEIIKKYGRDAINPRAAAHREQLLRIAAEQDRLGGASNDDMSVDNLSEMEGDSNIEMGGMDDEKSATGADAEGTKPIRKRKKKVEEYDKEDDFIDDTELAWQEQAAVAKDGFFVYSGPLVPEGQQAQVESTAPARGGRGRGRGSRGGRTAGSSGTTHASLADKTATTTSTTTTTTRGGRGSRGGRGTGATRKPRITKADKEKMESEKMDRERSAANINGSTAASLTPNANPLAPPQSSLTAPHQQSNHGVAQAVGGLA